MRKVFAATLSALVMVCVMASASVHANYSLPSHNHTVTSVSASHVNYGLLKERPHPLTSCNNDPTPGNCNGQPTPGGCSTGAYSQKDSHGNTIKTYAIANGEVLAYAFNMYSPHCKSNYVAFQCVAYDGCTYVEGFILRAPGPDGGQLVYYSGLKTDSTEYFGPLVWSPNNQTEVSVTVTYHGVIISSPETPLW